MSNSPPSSVSALQAARAFRFAGLALVALAACESAFPSPTSSDPGGVAQGGGGAEATSTPFTFAIEPEAALSSSPSVLQLRIDSPPDGAEPSRAFVAQGTLGPAHLRELAEDQVSVALSTRLVDVVAWADAGGAMHVAPTTALAPGQTYTLALADAGVMGTFTVSPSTPTVLPRLWPPAGQAASASFGVWCGTAALKGPSHAAASLEPGGPTGKLQVGVHGVDSRCVAFEGEHGELSNGARAMPPPSFATPQPTPLDPRPFTVDVAKTDVAPLDCDPGEIAVGPGCGVVEDDRITCRAPSSPALWAVSGAGIEDVFATNPGDAFVIMPLPLASKVSLAIDTFDTAGRASHATVHARTTAARPHLVINEVMANPLGPEPAEEWVELYNGGAAPADLSGVVLTDSGGATPLPSATIPPHGYALIVGADYQPEDGLDPSPAAGTLFVMVARVGKDGLSNDGEALALVAADGSTISSFPALPKPVAGLSVARVSPTAPDTSPSSFGRAAPTPGAPNILTP